MIDVPSPLLSTYNRGSSAGGRGSVPEPEAADLGALRGRRRQSRANSCHALSHSLLPAHTLFCSVKSDRSRVWEFSVERSSVSWEESAFASKWWALIRSSVSVR